MGQISIKKIRLHEKDGKIKQIEGQKSIVKAG